MPDPDDISRCAYEIAAAMPPSMVRTFARQIEDTGAVSSSVLSILPTPQAREVASKLIVVWTDSTPVLAPQTIAAALRAAAWAHETRADKENIELVWTGIDTDRIPLRRTEQVLLELIDSAQERLLFVSYAVYKARALGDALLRAVERGTALTLILEQPDPKAQESISRALAGLHNSLSEKAEILIWPIEKREKDERGQVGVLHAKCAVADGNLLFLSSANLTEFAFTKNMELGALIRGGALPGRVQTHFELLKHAGALVRFEN